MGRLSDFGIDKIINKTRLKLLEHLSELQEENDGRNTIFIFRDEMQNLLKEALRQRDFDEDADIFAKANHSRLYL